MVTGSSRPPMDERQMVALYKAHFRELKRIAVSQFAVPAQEAERLAHEVLVAGLRHYDKMPDRRVWLTAAMRMAARHFNSKVPRDE